RRAAVLIAALSIATAGILTRATVGPINAAARTDVRILVGAPSSFDPAAQSDATPPAITPQLSETLAAYDAALQLQPALAQGWDVADDGRSVVFHLRPNL